MLDAYDPRTRTGRISPHGGLLVDRQLQGDARELALEHAKELVQVPLSRFQAADLEMIAIGAYSPLTGFMSRADYDSVVKEMRLANGVVWSIPITLDIPNNLHYTIKEGQKIALVQDDLIVAIMEVREIFCRDKQREACQVYGTNDTRHPGVARLFQEGDILLSGAIQMLNSPNPDWFPKLRDDSTPKQTRQKFAEREWNSIVGFQTRNPIHRAQEYILNHALEMLDGFLLHPLVGETKADDIPAQARIKSYEVLLKNYYPAERVLLGLFSAPMRYAGPREALFHALCRKNYGCTHFIVGHDHAGVGNHYPPTAACDIFSQFSSEEIEINILSYPEIKYYCPKCGSVATPKICPHEQYRTRLSCTQIRQMLSRGKMPPKEFMRPEVSGALMKAILGRKTAHYYRHQAVNVLVNDPQAFIPRFKKFQWLKDIGQGITSLARL